ncbi:tyrosine-type recombinase/integrase [Mariniflexile sp. AS56]|uniref:tyrosine-type recombinase/integrase n=1 Tax=Mariniflexile sp. AS56 TaxID=3063957 RepID=UPI0034E974A7
MRHIFATHLLEYGVNIVCLKELLGHAHIEMTLTYLHSLLRIFGVDNPPSGSKYSALDKLYD